MKNLIFTTFVLVFCSLGIRTQAQTPAPVDPAWRTGTLANGMKYYIRQNPKPEGKAGFWIAHDIGALHETHNQNGLAHFLEHMAFNGLKNFPGKSMLEYMQSIGCAFGANINASTGQQLTQYMLTDVPIHREGIIDTCLLVLHDWSGHILCEQEELDAERGVIREEWRTSNNSMRRNYNELGRTLYSGTPYATRSVIGDTSIINNFTQKDILDFYDDWYRPNLQAVVIVGDFDVNMMENKVKKLFSTLQNPDNMKVKPEFNVPDNVEPITNVYKDRELTQNSVMFYIKFPAKFNKTNRNTEEFFRNNMVNGYISAMLAARFREAQQQPTAKFLSAFGGFSTFAGDRDAFMLQVSSKNNELEAGFKEVLTIVEQARRYGFTPTELERVKANMMQSYESNFAERNNKRHTDYNRLAYSNFQYNSPLMSEEQSLNLVKKFSSGIQVAELNELFRKMVVFGPNTIIYASGPDKADVSLPDNEMLRIIMYSMEKKKLLPYQDAVADKPLISKPIKAGKVIGETKNTALDAIEWTLSNGAKVVIKQTPFKQDEISLRAISFGGFSVVSDADWAATRNISEMIGASGVGTFDRTTLNKMLAGKRVSMTPIIGQYTQTMNGDCSPKDLETMLQLAYLFFTEPRFEQDEFDLTVGRLRNSLKNRSAEPMYAMSDTLSNLLSNYHLRAKALTEADLDKLSLAKIKEVYKQRYANPGAFTYMFVGNIDLKTAKPLIEKYIGGLSGNKKENWKDLKRDPVKGEVKRHFTRKMQTEKATVNVVYHGEIAYSPANAMAIDYLSRILRLRYTEEIREKRGGTYGASVSGSIGTITKEGYSLRIAFDTDPKMMQELVGVVHEEIQKIADNGPLSEDFQKTQTNMKSQFEQNQKENIYWINTLFAYYQDKMDAYSKWHETFAKTDPKAIQNMAKEILKRKSVIEVVMMPE